jgi:PadR family transcriptional regulator, regulatory protein AphA
MADWVPQPAAGPVLEFEALVKLFYAEHGSKQDILAALDRLRAWSDERHRDGEGISRAYLDGEGPFPERLPWLVLCGQFLQEFDTMVERWTEWAAAIVSTWPGDLTTAQPALDVLEAQARRASARPARTER